MRTPDKGRFAYVPVMTNASFYSNVWNSYGLMRAPWNSDRNPFMTRHDHLFGFPNNMKPSGCKEYKDTIGKENWWVSFLIFRKRAFGLRVGIVIYLLMFCGRSWSKAINKGRCSRIFLED